MNRLNLLLALALAAAVAATPARAGENAGATARIYWHVGSGPGLSATNTDMDSLVEAVVTVRGVRVFQGVDVQLTVQGPAGVPLAWQAQAGGCAESLAVFKQGGFGGAYPDIFTAPRPLTGVLTAKNGMIYQWKPHPCMTPDSTATIWLAAAGNAPVERDTSVEYAVLAFRLNLKALKAACAGRGGPDGSHGVCIYPNNHIPCEAVAPRAVLQLLDSRYQVDYAPFVAPHERLTWKEGGACKETATK
jgi:hypothetical protein